jgi:lipopolysaccharide/colanic/teichoic acid biosynthesis glycosyltransferase
MLVPYPFPKRLFDRVIAGALLVLVSPLFLVAVLAAALSGRGRVFRREPRISRGQTFDLLKFRTVRPGLPGEQRLLEREPANLTWAGRRLLKPWYLDELPQLVNILRGDMSLVGPRAWEPRLVAAQVERGLDYRLRIVAGLTGLAQATKGAPGTSYEALDLEYVAACERLGGWALVRLDLGILARSLRVLARGEGLRY